MRKLIAWVVLLCGFMPVLWAADGCDQHLSREEFRAKQKEFITEQAGLSKKEAAKFFPVYFELQDKKKKLNDESWDLMRKGKDDKMPWLMDFALAIIRHPPLSLRPLSLPGSCSPSVRTAGSR